MKIVASSPITSWQIEGEKVEAGTDFPLLGSKINTDGDWSHRIGRHLPLRRKAMTNLDSALKNRDITLPTEVQIVKLWSFQLSCTWSMWGLDHKEICVPKNWCFRIVVLDKILESPLDCKEIKPVSSKGHQPWKFTEELIWNWNSNTLVTCWKQTTHWKRPWWCERLKAKGERGGRRWDGWIASQTQWTWTWANSVR